MIKVQVIDNTNIIKSELSNVVCDISIHDDEVLALNALEKERFSVILLNYSFRKDETSEYIQLILNTCPESKIIVIADELSEDKILNFLLAGAKGYQEIKQLDTYASKLIKVIDAGEAWITRHMVTILLDTLRSKS